jgi:hypothetical protein
MLIFLLYISLVYLVTEKGWEKVWSNDTQDMWYQYYPVTKVERGL